MTSDKQIQANRSNGKKGGVKTLEGKAISRLNAVSHGLLSNDALLPGEDRCLLSDLRQKLISELKPEGELETILVERIVSCVWKLKRVNGNEKKRHRGKVDYRFSDWGKVGRYETTIERQIYRAVRNLKQLQEDRLGQKEPAPLCIDSNSIQDNSLSTYSDIKS